jgi:hypothetical protein
MSVVDFFNDELSLKDTSIACLQACAEAYGTVNASACALGCQSQLPSVEDSRKRLAMMADASRLNGDLFALSSPFNDYYGRMMDCMMQHVQHQMTIGWMVFSSSSSSSSDGGGRVVVIRGAPVLVFRQAPDNAAEYKTSNYLETNLLADDRGATPDVKRSQMMPMLEQDVDAMSADVIGAGHEFTTRGHNTDWLSCLSAKTGLSKLSVVFIIFSTFVVLMWFIAGVFFPTPSGKKDSIPLNQKLSIYGDHDYLTTIDEKKYLPGSYGDATPAKFVIYAPTFPLKMQEI